MVAHKESRRSMDQDNPASGRLYETDFIYNFNEAVSYKLFGRLFLLLPFSPNQITALGFLLNGLPSIYFFSLGTHLGYLLGILFSLTYSIFDWMDGYIAVNKNMKSNAGGFLDPMFDFIWQHLLIASLVLGVYNSKNQNYIWLVIGLTSLISLVVANYIGEIFKEKFDLKFRSLLGDFRKEILRNKKSGFLDLLGLQILAPTNFIFGLLFTIRYLLVIGAITNRMDIVIVFIMIQQIVRATALISTYVIYLNRIPNNSRRPIIKALESRAIKQ